VSVINLLAGVPFLINTPLQWGGAKLADPQTVSTVSDRVRKTVKTVPVFALQQHPTEVGC
jgi:hypothetical protein